MAVLCLFILLSFVFGCLIFSSEFLPGDDVPCKLLCARSLQSAFLCLFVSSPTVFTFDMIWLRLSCNRDWIRSGSVNVR